MILNEDTHNKPFVTNVGLITSNGSFGYDIMACEWTNMISYDPGLILLAIRKHKATFANILETKEFGVCITAFDQNVVSSVAGDSSGRAVDKIKLLEEIGVKFYKAKDIDVYMVEGTSLNVECKLVKHIDIGDHPLLIGEVISAQTSDKEPIIYHQGKYWRVGEKIEKPPQEYRDYLKSLQVKYKK